MSFSPSLLCGAEVVGRPGCVLVGDSGLSKSDAENRIQSQMAQEVKLSSIQDNSPGGYVV